MSFARLFFAIITSIIKFTFQKNDHWIAAEHKIPVNRILNYNGQIRVQWYYLEVEYNTSYITFRSFSAWNQNFVLDFILVRPIFIKASFRNFEFWATYPLLIFKRFFLRRTLSFFFFWKILMWVSRL